MSSMSTTLSLTALTSPGLMRQLPAALLHPAYFSVGRLQPWTIGTVTIGKRSRRTWLVPADDRLLSGWKGAGWSSAIWLSYSLARSLGVESRTARDAQLTFDRTAALVQPSRIDNYLHTHEIVVEPELRRQLLVKSKHVLLVSERRVMLAKPVSRRRSRTQQAGRVRLNYHARALMGVEPGPVSRREAVQVSSYSPIYNPRTRPESIWTWLRRILRAPIVLLEWIFVFLLRAPRVALAAEESDASDDSQMLVRVSPNSCELLGIESGDQVFVSWGRRQVLVRAGAEDSWEYEESALPQKIDWTPGRSVHRVGPDSRIAVPAKVRVELGAPRNSVLVVRRFVLSRVRRKLITLAIPLVGIAIAVPTFKLGVPLALGLVALALLLVFAGERLPRPEWRRWP
jgi:hypothetical protein